MRNEVLVDTVNLGQVKLVVYLGDLNLQGAEKFVPAHIEIYEPPDLQEKLTDAAKFHYILDSVTEHDPETVTLHFTVKIPPTPRINIAVTTPPLYSDDGALHHIATRTFYVTLTLAEIAESDTSPQKTETTLIPHKTTTSYTTVYCKLKVDPPKMTYSPHVVGVIREYVKTYVEKLAERLKGKTFTAPSHKVINEVKIRVKLKVDFHDDVPINAWATSFLQIPVSIEDIVKRGLSHYTSPAFLTFYTFVVANDLLDDLLGEFPSSILPDFANRIVVVVKDYVNPQLKQIIKKWMKRKGSSGGDDTNEGSP